MKKLAYVGMAVLGMALTSTAFAGELKPGDKTSCNNASSITLEAKAPADAVIWKSSNFTTIPIALGPGEENSLAGGRGVDMADKHTMGREKVVLTKQESFSRGDSIGDISGEVRITNTGHAPIQVSCQ